MQFIFTCSNGDIAFCPTEYLQAIINRIKEEPNKTFLIQSKNPATFNRVVFPSNTILGITLETNHDDIYEKAKVAPGAPLPSKRYEDFLKVKHELKMVTVEPVIEFDLDILVGWISKINPVMVWLGYDSRKSNLPEPELTKVTSLYWELGKAGYIVILKHIREKRS